MLFSFVDIIVFYLSNACLLAGRVQPWCLSQRALAQKLIKHSLYLCWRQHDYFIRLSKV